MTREKAIWAALMSPERAADAGIAALFDEQRTQARRLAKGQDASRVYVELDRISRRVTALGDEMITDAADEAVKEVRGKDAEAWLEVVHARARQRAAAAAESVRRPTVPAFAPVLYSPIPSGDSCLTPYGFFTAAEEAAAELGPEAGVDIGIWTLRRELFSRSVAEGMWVVEWARIGAVRR